MNKLAFLILLPIITVYSCKKQSTINSGSNASWQSVEEIDSHSKNITNSLVAHNSLYSSTSDFLIEYLNGEAYGGSVYSEGGGRRPMSDDYYCSYDAKDGIISIRPYTNPISGTVNPQVVGQDYSLAIKSGFNTDFAVFNTNQEQLLISVWMKEDLPSNLNFLLVDFSDVPNSLHIDSVQNIKVFNQGETLFRQGIYSFFGKFFVGLSSGLVLINEDGSYDDPVEFSSNFYIQGMFQIGGSLFFVSRGDIYESTDEGNSWSFYYTLPISFVEQQYFVVEDELIISTKDKLSRLVKVDGELEIEDLPSYGLEYNVITDIATVNENVYVSTYSGTFSKPYSEFIMGK